MAISTILRQWDAKLTLEAYEEEVLFAMYDQRLIRQDYRSIERVCSMIKWTSIARKYNVRKTCQKVLRHLFAKGYVDLHGKAANVASLTKLGVDYVLGKKSKASLSN
jgi:hypothetical protein